MKVMVARFVILLPVSSILNRSPTSDYVNSITDGVLSLALNFSSCCFQRLVCQLNPYLDTVLGLLGEAHMQIFRPSVESYEQSRSSGYSGENDL